MRESDLWPPLREYWHPVAFAEDVGDKPLAVKLLDEPIVVCRLAGRVAAFHDLCIHRGTPLSLGRVEGEHIICAYHGWAYEAGGKCIRIPSIPPEHPIPKKACLTLYHAQERYGVVWVCMADEPRAPIPEISTLDDANFRVDVRSGRLWKCSAARAIENFIDLGHLPWIHEGILGTRDNPLTPVVNVERVDEEIRFTVEGIEDRTREAGSYKRVFRIFRPFTIYLSKVELDGKTEVMYFACTPHTAKECTRLFMIARNYEIAQGGSKVEDLAELIIEQDRRIVENQRPEDLPLDLTEELHIKGPDAPALGYRRMMREIGIEA